MAEPTRGVVQRIERLKRSVERPQQRTHLHSRGMSRKDGARAGFIRGRPAAGTQVVPCASGGKMREDGGINGEGF